MLALALVLAVCGCSTGPDHGPRPEPPAPAAELGLEGTLLQYRRDAARRVLQLQVRSARPGLVVEDVELRAAGFAPTRRTGASTALRPGAPVDLPLPLSEARCGADAAGASSALLHVREDGGPARPVLLGLPAAGALLARLHGPECAERELRRTVDVALVGGWVPDGADGSARRTTLQLRRLVPEGPRVVVPELQSGVLFTVRTSAEPGAGVPSPVVVLEPGAPVAEVPLVVRATRCDAHALAESKRTTQLRVPVEVDGREAVQLVLQPDQAGRDLLVQYATQACGY